MTEKIQVQLRGVPETLLMTLYVRARESQRADSSFKDEKAVDIVKRLDCNFKRFGMQRHDEVAVIMRMQKFDAHVKAFLKRAPEGVVVHIGCGLDNRFERVDNGCVEWFDLDVPEVIRLRESLMPNENRRYHMLAGSVFEDAWLPDIEALKPHPFMFVSEGVLPYFEEAQVKALFLKLRERFPGAELVCDEHTPFVIWADNLQLAYGRLEARMHWSIKHGKDVEAWAEGICLLDEWNYYDDNDPRLKAFGWVKLFPFIAKSSGVFHYRLGE